MKTAITELKQLTEIIFAFDNDEAGNKAAAKYKEELQTLLPQVTFSKIILPCKDVNETLQAHSNEQIFIDLLNERTTDFFLSTEKETTAITDEPGVKLLIEKSLPDGQAGVERKKTQELKQQHPIHELNTDNPYKLRYTTDTANYFIQGGLPKTTDNMKSNAGDREQTNRT